ncbi:hypothetical protein JFL47_13735 [Haemophilus haemoglobinophilus]|nr:hypothetical protein [Canicola haemoglobinophilus]MBN6712257.1 hypothetical protein [Canicola haemoglobinophilus]
MKKCIVLFSIFSLCGCLDFFLYRENYTIDRMGYWVDYKTEKKVKAGIYKICSNYSKIKLNEKGIVFNYDNLPLYYEEYGGCLYNNGLRFRTTSWLYCYHKKEKCEIYNKYRK